jgi:hypothetical protein
MSSLAFYAAPIENEEAMPAQRAASAIERKRAMRRRSATIKKRPDVTKKHVAAMIEHIHQATGVDETETDGALADFNPPPPPQGSEGPAPYAGEDAPVGPDSFEALASGAKQGEGADLGYAHRRDYTQTGLREAFTAPYFSDMGDQGLLGPAAAPTDDTRTRGVYSGDASAGNREQLLKKLDYMIYLLEEQRDERTGHVTEEVVLYSFLGIFMIFMVDSFARAGKYVR